MSKSAEKALLNALLKMKEDFRIRQEKDEREQWKKVEQPYSLVNLLTPLSKHELDTIRKNLSLSGMSSLKKTELILALSKAIPSYFEDQLHVFDEERFGLVSLLAEKQLEVTGDELTYNKIQSLRSLGLVYPVIESGQKFLVLPEELTELFPLLDHPSILKAVRRNTEWIQLTHGMLYYYGYVSTSQMVSKIEFYMKEKINVQDYLNVIKGSADYCNQVKSRFYDGFQNAHLTDADKIERLHKKEMGIDFYPYSKEELLQAGVPGFVHRTPELDRLFRFLQERYHVPDEDVAKIQAELIPIYNDKSGIDEVMGFLQSYFKFPSRKFAMQVLELAEGAGMEIPRWELKGYTPKEWLEMKSN